MEIGIKNQIFLEKPEVGILILINWFHSWNDSFFAGMKLANASSSHCVNWAVLAGRMKWLGGRVWPAGRSLPTTDIGKQDKRCSYFR